MEKICENLNPKCKKISQDSSDFLYRVSGNAESLAWNMNLLGDMLEKDYAMNYDGIMRLRAMAARVDAISIEIVDLINVLDERGLMI